MQDRQIRRERLYELEAQIQTAAGTSQMEAVREYCTLQYEDTKEELVRCDAGEFQRLQGVAETYYTIIQKIENPDTV